MPEKWGSDTIVSTPCGDIVLLCDTPARRAANARLIAAAPDLLALAFDFLRLVEDNATRSKCDATLHGAFDYYAKNARAAIAKATGQA